MENNNNQNKRYSSFLDSCGCNTKRGSILWGVVLIVLGLNILGQELGYITFDIPAWTIVLVPLGLYLIARGVAK